MPCHEPPAIGLGTQSGAVPCLRQSLRCPCGGTPLRPLRRPAACAQTRFFDPHLGLPDRLAGVLCARQPAAGDEHENARQWRRQHDHERGDRILVARCLGHRPDHLYRQYRRACDQIRRPRPAAGDRAARQQLGAERALQALSLRRVDRLLVDARCDRRGLGRSPGQVPGPG
ncbi:hypothetical protein D3C77_429400 [compost metagenome]